MKPVSISDLQLFFSLCTPSLLNTASYIMICGKLETIKIYLEPSKVPLKL